MRTELQNFRTEHRRAKPDLQELQNPITDECIVPVQLGPKLHKKNTTSSTPSKSTLRRRSKTTHGWRTKTDSLDSIGQKSLVTVTSDETAGNCACPVRLASLFVLSLPEAPQDTMPKSTPDGHRVASGRSALCSRPARRTECHSRPSTNHSPMSNHRSP